MKTIKIFSFPSHSPKDHTSGVDYPRVIQPMKFLDGYSDKEVKIEVTPWDGKPIKIGEWDKICRDIDIVYLNYTLNAMMFASMGSMAEKNHVKVVMDVDDALWHINKDNTVYDSYKPGSIGIATFNDITNYVDYMTCTNSYLKNVIVNNTNKRHDRVDVFPNTVDTSLYDQVPEFKDTPEINIVHYGSSSHFTDLNDPSFIAGMERIMQDYPNVQFLTVGSFFGQFKMKWGRRYNEEFGALNFLGWAKKRFPQVMAKTDIFVAPLTSNLVYNKCKSSIKFIEVSTAQKVGCWQNIRQYQECVKDGVNGFLCDSEDSWYKNIKTLIDNPKLRLKMGKEAYKTTMDGWQSKQQVTKYASFFKRVLGY